MNLPHFPWAIFQTEIGLIALSMGALMFDIFLKNHSERERLISRAAQAGIFLLFILLLWRGRRFGSALQNSFVQDGVSFVFKGLFLAAGFFTLFMARQYRNKLKRGRGELTLLILITQIGMSFTASANDFLVLFVSIETITVSFYIMTAYLRDEPSSIEAGVKYLVLGALSTAIFLYGLSFIYGAAGSTSYTVIHEKIGAMPKPPVSFLFGMLLVIASLGFKIGAVPFQLWVPDIYEGAPTPVTAYLSIGSKTAGFAALVRIFLTVFPPSQERMILLLAILSALTILYGNLGAIPQTNIKRLLAYSSIGHAGYLLIGLAAFDHSGKEALLIYLMSYLVSAGGAFFVIVTLSNALKSDEISELAGLSQRSPVLAAGMLLSLLSLAGVPPLAGFFAKFYILWAGTRAGLLWLVVIGVLNVITSLYYYLKIVKVMYIEKPLDPHPLAVSASQKFMQYVSIAGILALGIFQGPFVKLAERAFAGF